MFVQLLFLFSHFQPALAFGVGSWTTLHPEGDAPPSKVYHSAAAVGNNLYITGGSAGSKGGNRTCYYNSFTNKWINQYDAMLPHDAQVADMTTSGGVLYLFGGKDTVHIDPSGSGIINSMHILRTTVSNENWQTVRPLHPPSERNGHSMVSVAGLLIIFGGWDETQYFDDVLGLDTTALVLPGLDARPLMWFKLTPLSGATPSARNSHTMVSVGHELLLFGGFSHDISVGGAFTQCGKNDDCQYFDDLWSLRLPAKVDQGLDAIEWKQLSPTGDHKPLARWWHAASAVGDRMYIYGGLSATGTVLSDVWSYSSSVNAWRVLAANPKGGSYGMSMSLIGGSLYVYGGFTEPRWEGQTNTLWRYDTPTVQSDDDGQSMIDVNTADVEKTLATDLSGVTAGLVVSILFNVVILGVSVFMCWKGYIKNGGSGSGGGGGGGASTYSEL
jgi:N-acetylneuraminic acid mutarotase